MKIAAYAEGILSTSTIHLHEQEIKTVGWNCLMVSLFHVTPNGDITFNGSPMVSYTPGVGSRYVGPANWPHQLASLKQGSTTINTLLATFGGYDSAFYNIIEIYNNNHRSFSGTTLESNCRAFVEAFPAFDLIDMDVEFPNGVPANLLEGFIAFCEIWIKLGVRVTFCPYNMQGFWLDSLRTLHARYPGSVAWWNLQCYEGGAGNDPQQWADAITNTIPGFDITGYIVVGDGTRYWNTQYMQWQDDCPAGVNSFFSRYRGSNYLGGGFLWTIDRIYNYPSEEQKHPDPNRCQQTSLLDYANALRSGLLG